jgi:hypothetical protein
MPSGWQACAGCDADSGVGKNTTRAWYLKAIATSLLLSASVAANADAAIEAESSNPRSITFSLEAGAQAIIESNAFWQLGDVYSPQANYDSDLGWGEVYVKPGVAATAPIGDVQLRAGLSAVASQTIGRDIFDEFNQGDLTLEDGYLGITIGAANTGLSFDLSGGSQRYKIGNGMLIADGAVDGFERGAVIFGPRVAWAMTAIAEVAIGNLSLEGFYLDPRELPSSDTETLLVGGKAEWTLGQGGYVGAAYGYVPQSTAPYVQAAPGGNGPPVIIPDGRDGLNFVQGFARFNPLPSLPGLYLAADFAIEWNNRIDMRASSGRMEIGNMFMTAKWTPLLSYSYQSFSGDNPDTPELERFDPLFYDGNPNAWASGTNGSFVFINSNINAHRFSLALYPTQADIVTLRYAIVSANELLSPIQFGQATRPIYAPGVPGLVTGVTTPRLSDDILAEYTHVMSANVYWTTGVAFSWPGSGLQGLAPGQVKNWAGVFTNIVVRY